MSKNDKGKEEFIHEDLNFEDAVEQLSIIVNTMENSDIDLDNIIENYQKGLSLLKFCQDKIKMLNLNSLKFQLQHKADY